MICGMLGAVFRAMFNLTPLRRYYSKFMCLDTSIEVTVCVETGWL